MFSKNGKGHRSGAASRRGRGRPPGATEQAAATRRRLYDAAVALIAAEGYEATTLRRIAADAGVSAGLLYRYFPSKRAVVIALYDELSSTYAAEAAAMPAEAWPARFMFALRCSLAVLDRQRDALVALTGVLVGDRDEGLFAPATASSRRQVQQVYADVVAGAEDPPTAAADRQALGRVLYVAHLAVILFWLLDRSPAQRASEALVAALEELLPMVAFVAASAPARAVIRRADALLGDALLSGEEPDT